MLPFGVTMPATVPQRSEIPEGLTNYPVYPHAFSSSALDGSGCSIYISTSGRQGNKYSTHSVRVWVGCRANLGVVRTRKIFILNWISTPYRPARNLVAMTNKIPCGPKYVTLSKIYHFPLFSTSLVSLCQK